MLQGQKKKNLRSSEWKASVVPEKDAPKEAEEKKADNEVETLRQNLRPLTNTVVYTPSRKKKLEVLSVSLDIEEDPILLEELVDREAEVVARDATKQSPASPRTSTRIVILETGDDPSAEET